MDRPGLLDEVIAKATGIAPGYARAQRRPALDHQSNHLYDVYVDGTHLIAKEYLRPDELRDAPFREFNALVLLEPYDVAPRPVYFNPKIAPIVVYEYMDGEMWDRTRPSPTELGQLAETWLAVHSVRSPDLWLSRGYDQPLTQKAVDIQRNLRRYIKWYSDQFAGDSALKQIFTQVTTETQEIAAALHGYSPALCFCRADPRFANVIRRSNGKLGLVDWEDSGLRDPARDVADMMTHPNQEDLLHGVEWDPFLDAYLEERQALDPTLAERVHLYLGLFPVWWLSILLGHGMERARRKSTLQVSVNDLPVNVRLRRYVARALSWPDTATPVDIDDLADLDFFPDAE